MPEKIKVDLYCRAESSRVGTFHALPGERVGVDLLKQRLSMVGMTPAEVAQYLKGCKNGRLLMCPQCMNNLEFLPDDMGPGEVPYRPQLGRFVIRPQKSA